MLVIFGSPSLVSANSLIESLATDAVTRSGCCRNTAREKPASSWRAGDAGRQRHGMPGRLRVVQQAVDAAQGERSRR